MICSRCGKGELQELTGTVLLVCPLCSSKLIAPVLTPEPSREAELEKCLGELVRVNSGFHRPQEMVDAIAKAKSLLNPDKTDL